MSYTPTNRNGYATLPWGALLLGGTGFDASDYASDRGDLHGTGFGRFEVRQRRYATYWALFENNIWQRIHHWTAALKETFDLYPAIRSIYSPAYRLGEFWAGHLWGGPLDPAAGDGHLVPSALPIEIPEANQARADAIRQAISQIWLVSKWQVRKDKATRFGSVLGDVALTIVDDTARQKVFLKVIHPRTIRHIDKDDYGNCKGYELEAMRRDPRAPDDLPTARALVRYVEIATKVGERVFYQTFLDDGGGAKPFDWRDYPDDRAARVGPEWSEPYGFVPFFHVPNRDVTDDGWGWSVFQPTISKLFELDDMASKLDDRVRAAVDPSWFFAGLRAPKKEDGADPDGLLRFPDVEDEDDDGAMIERNGMKAVYCPDPQGTATPLLANIDIAAASAVVLSILHEIERDNPELQADIATASGDASGRALRVARERVERDVADRRPAYDDALVRAHKGCISIGALKGYPGFEEFTTESYARGELDHAIGDRPVFAVDEMDRLEEAKARSAVLKELVDAGMPLDVAMEEAGYSEEAIGKAKRAMDRRAAEAEAAAVDAQTALDAQPLVDPQVMMDAGQA